MPSPSVGRPPDDPAERFFCLNGSIIFYLDLHLNVIVSRRGLLKEMEINRLAADDLI